jgi:hypothetical protein
LTRSEAVPNLATNQLLFWNKSKPEIRAIVKQNPENYPATSGTLKCSLGSYLKSEEIFFMSECLGENRDYIEK